MFYNLITGKVEPTSNNDQLHCYRADKNIFFCDKYGQHSLFIDYEELELFCKFLVSVSETKEYMEFKFQSQDRFTIAFENEDEGTRNLCMIDTRLYMIFNIQSKYLKDLSSFLMENQ